MRTVWGMTGPDAVTRFRSTKARPMIERSAFSVVIVNYRTPELVARCLALLAAERAGKGGFDVVVADGHSDDGSVEQIAACLAGMGDPDWIELLALPFNGGFGWANNQAMLRLLQRDDPPRFIALLNPDTEIAPGALRKLADILERQPRVAAVGSQLFEPDGSRSGSAFRFPAIAREFVRGSNTSALGRWLGIAPTLVELDVAGPVDWVTGASVMLRADALREVGLFDDGFFLYFEEVDLMHRLTRAGWQIWHEPESHVMHIGGVSTGVPGGAALVVPPRPRYWFASRRRFFARAYGPGRALMANLAWLAGHAVWRLRKAFGLGRSTVEVPAELSGVVQYGLAASASDFHAAVVDWRDAPGAMPAWSRWK